MRYKLQSELEACSTESGWVHFTIIDHVCFKAVEWAQSPSRGK